MPMALNHHWIDRIIGWQDTGPHIRARLLEIFCSGIRMRSLIGNLAAILIVGLFIISDTPTITHIAWLGLVAAGGFLPRLYAARLRAVGSFAQHTERKALRFMAINALYGSLWGLGPLLLMPDLSGNAVGVLLVMVIFGTVMGPYAVIPGILYARLTTTGLLTLAALAINLGFDVAGVGAVILLWLALRTDIWRSYHRAIRDQFELHELLASRQRRLEQANREKEQANRRLRQLAETDPLTGAGNRRQFLSRLKQTRPPVALILFDIDHFKQINDNHGHQAGDLLLKEVVRLAGDILSGDGVMARMGGDEFAILLPDADETTALATAEHIRERIAWRPLALGGVKTPVTLTLGVACVVAPTETIDPSALFAEADAALYTAKREGRNRSLTASAGAAAPPRRELKTCLGSTRAE